MRLDIDRAVPCGLVRNELIPNSLRHGFPDGRWREVSVRVSSEDDCLTPTIADTRVDPPIGQNSSGT